MEILKMLFKSQTRFCFRFNNSKHIPPNENNKQVVESIYVHSIHTWLIIVLVKFFFFGGGADFLRLLLFFTVYHFFRLMNIFIVEQVSKKTSQQFNIRDG